MTTDYNSMPLDVLCDIIEQRHHVYVREALATIEPLLVEVIDETPSDNPFLNRVLRKFRSMADNLAMHMEKEESILFPHIRKLEANVANGNAVADFHLISVSGVIKRLGTEHRNMREAIEYIRNHTSNYNVLESFSEKHQEVINRLREFDSDHKHHIHIEDNILFPKAIKLEAQLNDNH